MPDALADRDHPLWADAGAVARLVVDLGLDVRVGVPLIDALEPERAPRTLAEAHPWTRFDAVRSAWCLAAGLAHPEEQGMVDLRRARDLGIDTSASARDELGRGCIG
ncbi:hypothetical protein GCM10009809_08280 [Isoptericola hypogeus]|uniref:Uncharacterized protein n=1 Tax=Isoptericola hypogeus TaxID=300179 RepID=A0ABN2IYM9_9MICO